MFKYDQHQLEQDLLKFVRIHGERVQHGFYTKEVYTDNERDFTISEQFCRGLLAEHLDNVSPVVVHIGGVHIRNNEIPGWLQQLVLNAVMHYEESHASTTIIY